jgi:hypothetical protein
MVALAVLPALQLIDEPLPTPEWAPGAVARSKGMEWKLHAPPSADAAPRWGRRMAN